MPEISVFFFADDMFVFSSLNTKVNEFNRSGPVSKLILKWQGIEPDTFETFKSMLKIYVSGIGTP